MSAASNNERVQRSVLMLIAGIVVVLVVLWLAREAGIARSEQANYAFVLLIGATVGATELMSRYKDAPFAPLRSVPGIFYMAVNGGAAILAYYLLHKLGGAGLSGNSNRAVILRVLLAGLSAMAFFRSGVFTIRMDNSDVPVGPNLVMQILLQALDRTYDRMRAGPRSDSVRRIMDGVDFNEAKTALPSFCVNLMQNVSQAERIAVANQVKAIADAAAEGMNEEAQSLNLGLVLLNLVGVETLRQAVEALGGSIKRTKPLKIETTAALGRVDPIAVVEQLPGLVRLLSGSANPDADQALGEAGQMSLPIDSLAPAIVQILVRYHGEQVVAAALAWIEPADDDEESERLEEPASPPGPESPPEPESAAGA